MEIKRITNNNIDVFESLLTSETAADIRAGLPVTALGVFAEEGCIGAVAGLMAEENVFQITSMYVLPGFRRRGGGSLLLDGLNDLLLPFDARIDVEYNETHEDQKGMDDFFVINGYDRIEDIRYPTYMTSLEKLLFSDIIEKGKKDGKESKSGTVVCSFNELSAAQLNLAADAAREAGEPVPDGGLKSADVDRDLSFAVLKNDKVTGYVAIEKVNDTLVDVTALWGKEAGPKWTKAMLAKAVWKVEEEFPRDCRVTATGVTDKGDKLIDQLFEGNVITRKLSHYATPLFDSDELEYSAAQLAETEDEPLEYVSEIIDDDEDNEEE